MPVALKLCFLKFVLPKLLKTKQVHCVYVLDWCCLRFLVQRIMGNGEQQEVYLIGVAFDFPPGKDGCMELLTSG